MPRPPVLSGALRSGGAIELLRELEEKRITGELRFESEEEEGLIAFYGGAIAADQELRGDGRDPVDVLLEMKEGTYEIHPRLPALAVSKGDDLVKTGSLAIYDAGELLAIELDGRGDADLSEVFAWEQGRFRIELDASAPEQARAAEEAPTTEYVAVPKKRRDDTRQFLRVVEMALVDVLDSSERARSPTRTSPPMPEPPKARARPPALPPPPPPRRRTEEHTVRLIYLSGEPPTPTATDTSTRHVAKGRATEVALTDARPERRAAGVEPPELDPMAKKPSKKKNPTPAARTAPKPAEAESEAVEAPRDDEAPEAEAREEERVVEAPREKAAPSVAAKPPPSESVEAPAPKTQQAPESALGNLGWAIGVLLLGVGILALLAQLPPLE
jgi:hypothetical protein